MLDAHGQPAVDKFFLQTATNSMLIGVRST